MMVPQISTPLSTSALWETSFCDSTHTPAAANKSKPRVCVETIARISRASSSRPLFTPSDTYQISNTAKSSPLKLYTSQTKTPKCALDLSY